ncbi:MAG: hypothetical protein AAFX90_07310 [Pseudomonadota bacterium]
MKYVLVFLCVLLAGCETVRSTTDRVFGRSEAAPETEANAEPEAAPETEPVTTRPNWDGAKSTTAVLGDPSKPGRWMQTPLVDTEVTARVVVPRTGAQAYITLIPSRGPEGGGSQLSLDAMRTLLVPLDALVEVDVYAN